MSNNFDFGSVIIPIFLAVLLVLFLRQFFTQKGRLSTVKFLTGAREVNLLGELSPVQLSSRFGFKTEQKMRLYRCSDRANIYYILEVTNRSMGRLNRNFVKLDPPLLAEIERQIKTGYQPGKVI